MSDFPSLNSLTGGSSGNSAGGGLKIASDEMEEKFREKMKKISIKEKEVETMRSAAYTGYAYIDLERFPISQEALRQLPIEQVKENGLVCFYVTDTEFRLGALDPDAPAVQETLKRMQEERDLHGALYSISQKSYERVLDLYTKLPVIKAITKDISVNPEELKKVEEAITDFASLQALLDKESTTHLLTYIMAAGFKLDASDIHIEAEEGQIVVRFRMDGILNDAATLPKEAYKQLVSRVKLLSALKINVTDKPQDGRFGIKLPSGDVDVRVSTIPTVYGESVVMRLLRQSREGLTLDKLGFIGESYEKLVGEIKRPNGMIITTGPTGSGKTTTLYAVMHMLNQPGVKIITLEDPVEYKMEGINQSQIDHSRGYTFAKGLRSMMRQDPDIAMVGEIRDLETADIAVQAALTGHLILSTIHTNSAAGAIPRFLSMGVKPFLLAPALNSVIGQRLVRKICQECKYVVTLDEKAMKRVQENIERMPEKEKAQVQAKELTFYASKGCEVCNGLGYKGRVGIYEIFIMNPDIEQMILTGQVSEYEIEKIAIQNGMVTMVQDGILKALEGQTSIEEVFRVIE
ncbi:type II/IV secretion system protein [Candidatus Nomurabacteria bacterium]|nr:type II/IV secretion system protein [Candidatus Nomurabacteria bacterium]